MTLRTIAGLVWKKGVVGSLIRSVGGGNWILTVWKWRGR